MARRRRKKGRSIKVLLAVSFVLGALLGAVLTSIFILGNPSLELAPRDVYRRSITIVGIDRDGNGKLATLTVELRPGSGHLALAIPPFENDDSQRSAVTARSAAASETGYKLDRVDITVSIDNLTPDTTLSGPSASASIALLILATIRAQENKVPNRVRPDVVISASINSLARLDPVGVIAKKYDALKGSGEHWIFIISKYQAEQLTEYPSISMERADDLKQLAELALW